MAVLVDRGILSLKLCFPEDTVFACFKGGLVLGFGTGVVRIEVLVLGFGTGGVWVFGINDCLVLFNEDGL